MIGIFLSPHWVVDLVDPHLLLGVPPIHPIGDCRLPDLV